MHQVRDTSMAYFDFDGRAEVSITYNRGPIRSRPCSPLCYGIKPQLNGNTLTFELSKPRDVSVEINGDIFHNLQIFTNPPETDRPDANDPAVIYIKPGFHTFPGGMLDVPGGKTLYVAGGAVVNAGIRCRNAENVRIIGRGILYQPPSEGIQVVNSKNVLYRRADPHRSPALHRLRRAIQ